MSTNPDGPEGQRPRLFRALPNLLTSIRLALGVAFPFIPAGWRLAALLVAVATEFLDGQAARLLRVVSATGRILDPIADKVFVVAVLATLMREGTLAPWHLILVASRDLVVAAGALWVAALRGPSELRRMPPSLLGKSTTAAQLLFLLVTVASREMSFALLIVTSVLSIAAGIDYAVRFR